MANDSVKLVTPDQLLESVIGSGSVPRTEVIKKFWDYVNKNNLKQGRNVLVSKDAKLTALFESNKDVTMFQVMGVLSKHLKK